MNLNSCRRYKDALLIFALLLFSYSYFFHDPAHNGNSRLALVFAIVHEHRLVIDSFHDMPGLRTGDKALYAGHYYSDKAIGTALLGTLAYLPISSLAAFTGLELSLKFVKYLLTVLSIGVPSALAGALMFMVCRDVCGSRWKAFVVTLSIALGTLCFPYSALFYGHQLAAALLFGAFYLIFSIKAGRLKPADKHLCLIGFLLAMVLVSEFPSALLIAPLMVYYFIALTRSGHSAGSDGSTLEANRWQWKWLALPVLGGLLPVVIQGAYNALCFGSPLQFGYHHEALEDFRVPMSEGLMGVTIPSLRVLYYLTVHPSHGLFWFSPVLVMSVLGIGFMLFRKPCAHPADNRGGYRAEALLSLFALVSYLLFNSGYYDWWGGWAIGPRHLIPMLPFLALPLLFLPRRLFPIVAVLAAVSVSQMVIVTSTQPQAPNRIKNRLDQLSYFEYVPVYHYSWRRLTEDKFAWNVARMALRLNGFYSLIPLLIVLGSATFVMTRPRCAVPP